MRLVAKAKQIPEIGCDGPGYAAIALVFKTRMAEMCALRESALDRTNPEGVHDMRVASRRLRSASRDFVTYFGQKPLAKYLEDVRILARLLGSVRDYDVAIVTLRETATSAPSEIANGICRLAEFDDAGREVERLKLERALEVGALRRLESGFVEALDAVVECAQEKKALARGPLASAGMTYREVARSVLLGHLKEVEERSRSLYRPSKVRRLHKMRLAAKRFRYALELFDQCWTGQVAFFARKLAGLQSSLGKLHDCDVWIRRFGDAATDDQRSPDFDYRATTVWLLSHFVKVRTKHFLKALTQWNEWESSNCGAGLRRILMNHSAGYKRTQLKEKVRR